jgi:hypothetical protein
MICIVVNQLTVLFDYFGKVSEDENEIEYKVQRKRCHNEPSKHILYI